MPDSRSKFYGSDETSSALVIRFQNNGVQGCLVARWIFLRALAAIYFSAFFSLAFQIKGLVGPQGILPAQEYLISGVHYFGTWRYWQVPSLIVWSASAHTLMLVIWIGMLASALAFVNLLPRVNFLLCFICFLSFVAIAEEFSGYQSDGMLLEAGFLALFFWAPAHIARMGSGPPALSSQLVSTARGVVPNLF